VQYGNMAQLSAPVIPGGPGNVLTVNVIVKASPPTSREDCEDGRFPCC
jgi:hypothetical protein